MPDAAIQLSGIHKSFGKTSVLNGLDLDVPAGKTYAFLGRNGAGKTTTIRMLMGLLKPDAGTLRVGGHDPRTDPMAVRAAVGYLAEDQQMWGWMKVSEILHFVSAFYPLWDWRLVEELAQKFALAGNTRVRHLSKGQNVRLGLLLALAHKPRLVILDDPALGLDPIMRKEFLRDLVTHLQGRDVTVFFSSHLLYEIEPVADIIGILDHGRLVCQEETETLREQVKLLIIDAADWPRHAPALAGITLDVRRDGPRIAVVVRDAARARSLLGPALREESALNLDEIFEAFVVGRKEAPLDPRIDLERVA